jgi:hypothetical protein
MFGTAVANIGVATDSSGSVVVAGGFAQSIDFGAGPTPSAGSNDVFLAKFDGTGSYAWSKTWGDSTEQHANGVATDSNKNIVIGGAFDGSLAFGGPTGPLMSAGGSDVFLAKLDAAGGYVWAKSFGGVHDESGTGPAIDPSGNVFLAGDFWPDINLGGSTLMGAGKVNVFLAKFDPAGNHQWSMGFGDATQRSTGVAADASGNVVLTGTYTGAINFGGSPLPSAGGSTGVFVAEFDASGNYVWSQGFTDGVDVFTVAPPATDSAGNVWLTGSFSGSINLGGAPVSSMGGVDVFVAKFSSTGAPLWSKTFGNGADQYGYGIATDANDNVILTGGFAGSIDFGGALLQAMGQDDCFIAKLDHTGSHLWSNRYGDPNEQDGYAVASDPMGNVLAVGLFQGSIDFGNGSPLTLMPAPDAGAGDSASFLAKLAP